VTQSCGALHNETGSISRCINTFTAKIGVFYLPDMF
jgi:hypothetical protein